MPLTPTPTSAWPLWRKVLFRFFCIYILLQITPWGWMDSIPGVEYITKWYYSLDEWAVYGANKHLFHVRDVLVPLNGSGDTSYGWTQLWLYLTLACLGAAIWSVFDRRRASYNTSDFWLRTFTRYYVAMVSLSYGIIKVFMLQMSFPTSTQLATPLGDLLPMRFSWLFIGYSTPYQVFSGVMEVIAGLLLLNRKTITLGLFIATGVFVNVLMLNLCYDVPVKLFAMHMLFYCLFLLAHEQKRLVTFFILNKPTAPTLSYEMVYTKKWQRITRIVFKALFLLLSVGLVIYNTYHRYEKNKNYVKPKGPDGPYIITRYVENHDTIQVLPTDTLRWKDIIFDDGFASIRTGDTMLWRRYGRGCFLYKVDTLQQLIKARKKNTDSLLLFTLHYEMPDSNRMRLWTQLRGDSIYMELQKNDHHYQLTDRQFHWLSESNR